MPSRAPPACRDLQPELKQGFHTCQSGRDRTPQHGSRALGVKERTLSQRRRLRHPGRVCCFLHTVKVRLWQQECASSNLTGTAERTRARARGLDLHLVPSPTRVIFLFVLQKTL